MEGIEPTTPRLQITCSGQLSYIGNVVFRFGVYFLNGIAKVDIIFKSPKLFRLFLNFFRIYPQKQLSTPQWKDRILPSIPPVSPDLNNCPRSQ